LELGRAKNARTLSDIRVAAGGGAARRGKAAGTAAGERAGQAKIAARGAGPTELPSPLLPTSLYDLPPTGFTERPSEIILGNHATLKGISWSSWGDTATGTGTLLGDDCDPNCAEGSPTEDPATIEATDPSFTPQDKRYYSRVRVISDGQPPVDLEVKP
jgi:hypothetical protein